MSPEKQIGNPEAPRVDDEAMGRAFEKSKEFLLKKAQEAGGLEVLAKRLGVKRATFYTYFAQKEGKKVSIPNGEALLTWLEHLGVQITFPEEKPTGPVDTTREVCWVRPEIVSAEDGPPPKTEDYFAVPLAEERVAAGKGLIPGENIRGWVLVWRYEEAIRFKRDLVAVQIGENQFSMVPTLYPGDIVLVDRADKDPSPPGKIMLVMEPGGAGDPGGAMIKRVSTKKDDGDIELIYYSDNAKEYPPFFFKLNRDYGGDISRAIAGRVVWAWKNMTKM